MLLQTTPEVVRRNMVKYNIPRRSASGRRVYKPVDLTRLEGIKDRDLAYVLGYMAWGGSIIERLNTYFFTVQKKDSDVLYRIKDCLSIDNKIYGLKDNPNFLRLGITQKGLPEALDRWYYGSRDSRRDLAFPPNMPKKYVPDYLKGYFDKHGSVIDSNHDTAIRFSCPTKKFLDSFRGLLTNYKIDTKEYITTYTHCKTNNTYTGYRAEIRAESLIRFFELVYGEDYSYETRKKEELITVMRLVQDRITKKNVWKKKLNRDTLRNLYTKRGLTIQDIADRFECSIGRVSNALQRYSIKIRPSHYNLKRERNPYLTKENLTKLYVKQGITMETIGDRFGCATSTVGRALKQYNIKPRTAGVPRGPVSVGPYKDLSSARELEELYYEEGQTCKAIGEELGVPGGAVYRRMCSLGLL